MNVFQLQQQAETMGGSHSPQFVGDLITGVTGLIGGERANKASAKQAREGREHSDYQLQNKHQWQVEDLRKAGLNPIISTHGTSAGSSPIASQENIASGLGAALSGAASSAQAKLSKKKLNAEIELLKSQAYNARQGGNASAATAANTRNISNVTRNFGNIATSAHESTAKAAARASRNLRDVANIKQTYKQSREIRKKDDYQSPTKRLYNRFKNYYFSKGN